jgi:hypothetical protein
MAVHVVCPSLRCRKILTLGDEVRGTTVTCRYCSLEFRVPHIRKPELAIPDMVRGATVPPGTASSATPLK